MDSIVILIGLTFIMALFFYGINIHFPHSAKLKYYVALVLFALGCLGWLSVLLRYGWLLTAVISSWLLVLSVIAISIALLMDLYDKKRNKPILNV
ncbi:hypothetical protein DYI25_20095 [Mesobacillus boroniphilus]|uniref:YesK-like protein n=1 Tax=Mesobacillus boroniphilus TaxID=308892 RepID=A0A944CP43_9BACI|nr:hypothetical protein [Mesobacillus boroniphilus]MBS8266729.1 hypothetical protein [Mesobacillus boroniphilus]